MNLFETVKSAVTVKQAAEYYGCKVNRGDMICCPFHDDRHPSMKLNRDYFYCFGCGATGDVIDFVARLFGLSSYEAAKKLAYDFGIDPDKPPAAMALKKPYPLAQDFRNDEIHCQRVLCDYLHLLERWKVEYAPQSPEDELDDRFVEACHMIEYMDEKTPHMHLCFVPLTEDGRLSAKDIMGNKKKLTWWQDEFWKHMVKKFPDLERGESASLTGRDHIPPRVFKEMTRLTKQKSKLEDLLTGINPFNAKSRAEEICKILDSYIPSVEKMDTLLRKYGVAFTKTASENKKLKTKNAELEESLASAQKVSTLKQIEDLKLRRDYDSAVAILEQIPAEVLNIYAQSSHRGKERPIEQSL